MVRAVNSVLNTWHRDPNIVSILVEGAPREKTTTNQDSTTATTYTPCFCAGGDVKKIALEGMEEEKNKDDDKSAPGYGTVGCYTADFFREEYVMNHAIASRNAVANQLPSQPQVSLWDGVVMGGGVGISIHGAYRVATEKTIWAMPETAIGIFADVGMMYHLSRYELPSEDGDLNVATDLRGLGVFLALTGWRLRADDLLYAGLATHYVDSSQVPELRKALLSSSSVSGPEDVGNVLDEFQEMSSKGGNKLRNLRATSKESFLGTNMPHINSIFTDGSQLKTLSMQEILRQLSSSDSQFAQTVYTTLRKMSPTAMVVTLEALRRASAVEDLGDVLSMEYRVMQGFMRHGTGDFYEGIRTKLIEKDSKSTPGWSPKKVEDVRDIEDRFFKTGVLKEELILSNSMFSSNL